MKLFISETPFTTMNESLIYGDRNVHYKAWSVQDDVVKKVMSY